MADYTLKEAAKLLGATETAIRVRVQRGTMKSPGKNQEGRLLVTVDEADLPPTEDLLSELRHQREHLEGEVEHLRAQNTELLKLLQRFNKE